MMKFVTILAVAFLVAQGSFGGEFPDLTHYKYGEGKAAEDAETILQSTPVDRHGAIEDALIAVVASKDATQDGKACACRMLQQIGTEKCVPSVAGLLTDEVLSHYARLVLERMGGPKADEALRTALGNAPDKVKVGLLGSLGARRDAQAVQQAAVLAAHSDPAVASAAISALGRIGGASAAECLSKLKPAEALGTVHRVALVDCARSLNGAEAVALYQLVLAGKNQQRMGALSGMLAADEKKAVVLIADCIKGDDVEMSNGALTLVVCEKSDPLTAAMTELLGTLPDEKKIVLVTALGARGDKTALSSIVACRTSANEGVRNAALNAIIKLGDAGIVPELLSSNDGATDVVAKMVDSGVNDALIKALETDKLKVPAIKALVTRTCLAALPKLFDLLKDGDAEVRTAAWAGIGSLATEADIDAVAKTAFALKDPAEMALGVRAARDICARATDKAKCFDVVATHYKGTTDESTVAIVELASLIGSPSAMAIVKKALQSGNKELHGKALRSLAAWCNESASDELLELSKNAPEEVERILALRGYIRIAGLDSAKLNADQRSAMFKTAAELAKRADEKKLIIGGMQQTQTAVTFAIVIKYIDDPEVQNEAEQYALAVLEKRSRRGPPSEAKELANKLLTNKNKSIADRAKKALDAMGK